jgi:F0F1-type ATP synthase delta subunit
MRPWDAFFVALLANDVRALYVPAVAEGLSVLFAESGSHLRAIVTVAQPVSRKEKK